MVFLMSVHEFRNSYALLDRESNYLGMKQVIFIPLTLGSFFFVLDLPLALVISSVELLNC